MTKKTKMGILFVCAMTAYGFLRGFVKGTFEPSGSPQALQSELNAMRLRLPVTIDADTQLWGTSVDDHVVSFHYRIVTRRAADVEKGPFVAQNRDRLVSATCNDRDLQKRFLSEGTTVQHKYSGRDNFPIADIVVKPENCAALR